MKSFIFCSISVLLLMCGCGGSHADPQLVLADSLMTSAPDSAYTVLKAIDPKSLSDSHNRAYYALLFTQAQYKALDSIHSDSLINIAVDYYDDNHDREKYTRTLIYKGAALSDMGEQTEALLWYKNAVANADTSDYMNLGQANMRIAELYRDSYFSNEVDIDGYKIALGYYRKANNKKYQIMCLGTIGGGYRGSNIDSAYFYLNKAIDLAKETKDSVYIFYNLSMLARAYYRDSQYQKGKDVAVYTIKYGAKFLEDYDCYYDATKCYIKLNMMDSAMHYFNKSAYNSKIGFRVSRLITLREIEIAKENYKKALEYNILSDNIADSINTNSVCSNLLRVENRYDKQYAEMQNSEKDNKITLYSLIILCIALIVIILLGIIKRKRNQICEIMALMERIQNDASEAQKNMLQKLNGNTIFKQTINHQFEVIMQLVEYSYQHGNDTDKFINKFRESVLLNKSDENFWRDLKLYVNESYNNVITSIENEYTNLSNNEIFFICMTCCKFSNIHIMICMGYTNERSVYNKRNFLLKKMGISTSLDTYLEILMNNK